MHDCIVGETLKADLRRSTLLRKRLLPVLYLPTIVMTPKGLVKVLRKSAVSGGTSNFPSRCLMSCRG